MHYTKAPNTERKINPKPWMASAGESPQGGKSTFDKKDAPTRFPAQNHTSNKTTLITSGPRRSQNCGNRYP